METILLPKLIDAKQAILIINEFSQIPEGETITLDFSRVEWLIPFSLLYLSNHIRILQEGRKIKIDARFPDGNYRHSNLSYLDHMAFYRNCGFKFGNRVGHIKGTDTNIPITSIPLKKYSRQALNQYVQVYTIIEQESARLAKVLAHQDSGDVFDALQYCFREIIRNVYEHSESGTFEYCAQYWPQKHRAEIALLDNGRGLRASLSQNPYLEIENDRDAVQFSFLPAISGTMYKGVKKKWYNVYQNSGYGLYMTSRLCRSGNGVFLIGSGDAAIMVNEVEEYKIDYEMTCHGTVVQLVLDTSRITNLRGMLRQFTLEGYEISRNFEGTGKIKASTASRLVTKDFRP